MLADTLLLYFQSKWQEHIFIFFFTGTKYNDLDIFLTKLIHYICDQIKALLICQSGNNTDHKLLIILLQAKLLLRARLFLIFSLRKFAALYGATIFLSFSWIEFFIINTVDDTTQRTGSCTQQSIQPFSVKLCLNFFRISIGNCCYRIRINDTTL